MSNKLELKSINEILDYDFFIPSYQRGYKWDEQQVLDLLNDIYEFANKYKVKEEFYCLQPIVVLPETFEQKIRYRVIDGQQRLTTIYIILKYLENLLKEEEEYNIKRFYTIEYETRNNSKDFLEKHLNGKIDKTNPDFYYMSLAFNIVKEWFKEKIKDRKITKRKFIDILLGLNNKDVKFIWYELPEKEDEIKVFTRLNIGKIPLSNSELIKAILLFGLQENEKFELISEWDYIEKNLQNDRFFSFLTTKEYKNTRIDFIFDLLAKNYNDKFNLKIKENDKRFSFYIFDRLIKEKKKNKKELWSEIKEYFRIFEELFNNENYYHYVGFLVNISSDEMFINEIIELFKTNKKNEFELELKERMEIELKTPLQNLEYNSNYKEIEKLLFLFNILITMESGYSRYPFDIHNKEKWSLEHIHAQNSEGLKENDKIKLLELLEKSPYIDYEIKKEIKELLKNSKIEDKQFEIIQQKINLKITGEKDEIHTIDNLALLSKNDNSSLNNSIFPEKRAKIKELDKEGRFIPLGTKNVFMKYYSDKVDEFLTWNQTDRKSYFKVLEEKLTPFIKVEK